MQTVIGEFDSQAAAQAAVRNLEAHGLSIQNVLIVDQQHRVWRRPHPRRIGQRRDRTGFVVLMFDGGEHAGQARRLLGASAFAATARST